LKNVGGQAVIEGVMMKAPGGWSVAVRVPTGEIKVKNVPLAPEGRLLKLPLVRGVLALFQALIIGIKALEFSAVMATEEDEEPLSASAIAMTVATSLGLAVLLFIVLPLYATKLLGIVAPSVDSNALLFNAVDGVIRVFVFLLYVLLIGLWGEIRRVFEYHGAEHKVIHAFEEDPDMAVGDIMLKSSKHPRCGTSFLLIVMVLAIIIFSFIPQSWPMWAKLLSRVVLLPLVAGVSYEALKLSAKKVHNPVMRVLMAPGLWLQGLTTREPDEQQIEVALRALKEALLLDEKGSPETKAEEQGA